MNRVIAIVVGEATQKPMSNLPLLVREIRLPPISEWDEFAETCQSSYMGSHGYVTAQRFFRRVRVFSVFLDSIKIAQCAIAFKWQRKRRVGEFVDALQILPTYHDLWLPIMEAVLQQCGSGTYTYGSKWSIETPRQDDLCAIDGVSIIEMKSYLTQVVDFSQWPTWEAYEKAISSNVKRNAAKAVKTDPTTSVIVCEGIQAAREALPLTNMRFKTRRRKGLEDWTSFKVAILRYIARTMFMRNGSYTAKVIHRNQTMAYFSGIDFGLSTFYIDGASLPDNGGAAWLLILRMLRRAWKPYGKFFLAMYEVGSDWTGRDDILLSRQHCRPTEYPNTVIDFEYRPSPL